MMSLSWDVFVGLYVTVGIRILFAAADRCIVERGLWDGWGLLFDLLGAAALWWLWLRAAWCEPRDAE